MQFTYLFCKDFLICLEMQLLTLAPGLFSPQRKCVFQECRKDYLNNEFCFIFAQPYAIKRTAVNGERSLYSLNLATSLYSEITNFNL